MQIFFNRPLIGLALLALAPAAAAAPQGFDARSKGMGGTSVASSRTWSAPLHNPALLGMPREGDNFGVLLPTVAVEGRGREEYVDDVSAFADQFDELNARFGTGTPPTQGELDALADSLLALAGEELRFSGQAGVALSVPGESLGVGLMLRGNFDSVGLLDIAESDADAIRGALGATELPELDSEAVIRGGARAEIGLALARQFELFGTPMAIGLTPKAQTIETINYVSAVEDFEEGRNGESVDPTDDQFRTSESVINADLGFAARPTESLTLGLTVTDLVAQDINSAVVRGTQYAYQIRPVATAGVALDRGWFTLAADLDLTKREPLDFAKGSQFLSLGAEVDAGWAQLRGGYRMDLEGGVEDALTAGLGVSPFGAVRLDIAGLLGEDTYGAALELSFTF